MVLVISSTAMAAFLAYVLIHSHKSSRKSNAFFARANADIADLASRVESRYIARFGRRPTLDLPVLAEGSSIRPALKDKPK